MTYRIPLDCVLAKIVSIDNIVVNLNRVSGSTGSG